MRKTLLTVLLCAAGSAQAAVMNSSADTITLSGTGYTVEGNPTRLQLVESDMDGSQLKLIQAKVSSLSQDIVLGGTEYQASDLAGQGYQDVIYAQGMDINDATKLTIYTHSSTVTHGAGRILVQNSDGVVLEMEDGLVLTGGKLGGHAKVDKLPIHNSHILFGYGVAGVKIKQGATVTLENLEASIDYSVEMEEGATLVLNKATLRMGNGAPLVGEAKFTVSNNADDEHTIVIKTGKDAMRGLGLQQSAITNATLKGTGRLENVRMQGGRLEIGHTDKNNLQRQILGQMTLSNVETSNTTWHFNICTEGHFNYAGANADATGKFSQLKVEKHGNYGENVTISIGYVDEDGNASNKSTMQTFQRGASITLIDTTEGTVHGSYFFDWELLPTLEDGLVWYTYDLFKSGTVYVVDDLWNTISLISGDGLIPYGELETILAQNQLADASRVANTMAAAARTTASFGNSALAHADDYRARHSNIWFSTYYSSQERDSTGHRTGYKSTTTGYAVGIDTLLRKYDAIVGLALGKSNGKMTPDSGNRTYTAGTIDQDGMQIGLYGRMNQVQPAFHENSVNAEAYITYGQYDCRSERSGRGNGESVSACWDEKAWALGVRVSRNYWWRHGMILTPFAGFEYTMADMDSMREMGYTAIDYSCVRVHRQLELLGGLRAQRTLQLRNGQKLTPYGSLGLGFDLLRHNAKVRTASAVGSFSDEATDPGKLSLKLQLGADWFITPRWNTAAGYTFEIRDAAAEHYLQLSASRAF